ncbi:hypothetical protein D9Q98_006567 [Chlorella vulgaris]|uniref:Transmembrane protein n=1 Tax=Chlorella vulgaris TaxID=3077 RepID=A0A9D4YV48_CHLVU|nr:hypothetical protein D9Q98_006567 [Chlorella vulgaris]
MAASVLLDTFQQPFGATHSYVSMTERVSNNEGAELPRRLLPSPPQPVPNRPRPRSDAWEDADSTSRISPSPTSESSEHFLDCFSEAPSAGSSLGDDNGVAADVLMAGALASARRTASDEPLAASSAPASTYLWRQQALEEQQQLQEERQRRLVAEMAAAGLRQQLDDISALLFAYRSRCSGSSSSSSIRADGNRVVVAEVEDVLRSASQQDAAHQQQADSAAAAAEDAAFVARLAATMCVRAATLADVQAACFEERALLERRLEQSTRMGRAMLKHQKEHGSGAEPWRQQLLGTAFAVGCSVLGASAALLIIRRSGGA